MAQRTIASPPSRSSTYRNVRGYLTGWFSNVSVGLIVGATIALLIDHKVSIQAGVIFFVGLCLGMIGLVMAKRR